METFDLIIALSKCIGYTTGIFLTIYIIYRYWPIIALISIVFCIFYIPACQRTQRDAKIDKMMTEFEIERVNEARRSNPNAYR